MADECFRAPCESSEDSADFYSHLSFIKRIRRKIIAPFFRLSDTGFLGLTPLRTHIMICGFPRSGTTLLQMMLENGIPDARRFGRETGAWRAATFSWRNHAVVISKVPQDVFRLEALRKFYKSRKANLRIILMVRDPRDVLTSQRKTGGPSGYVVGPERWLNYYNAFRKYESNPDVLVVRYEDLVSNTAVQQQRIEAFTGEKSSRSFESFHSVERPDFETNTLNGLRPVEQSLIARWSGVEHRGRILEMVEKIPVLPEALVHLGYEPDDRWISSLRNASAA